MAGQAKPVDQPQRHAPARARTRHGEHDLNNIKGRIAEALVESIFRQAGYTVSRLGRESQVERLMQSGPCEFLPDFLIWKRSEGALRAADLYRLVAIEAKYRADLRGYLRNYAATELDEAKARWPDAYFVFVTDNGNGRSCFQALHLANYNSGQQIQTTDLCDAAALKLYRSNVDRHEDIARRLFRALSQSESLLPAPEE